MTFAILRIFVEILTKPFVGKVNGLENIPLDGPLIFAANHASYLDHFIIGYNISKRSKSSIHTIAKKEHFDKFFERKWHEYLKAIPVDRSEGGQEAVQKAVDALVSGKRIFLYPEGTRTLTGKMNRAKTGVARLVLGAKVPVIPIGLTNTFPILPKGARIPKFGIKTDINIGKPLYFKDYYNQEITKENIRKVTTTIMKEIATLANKTYEFD